MRTGKPMSSAAAMRASSEDPASFVPGTRGTPWAETACFAVILSPIVRIASGPGPRKTMPAASQAAEKSAFSERNP